MKYWLNILLIFMVVQLPAQTLEEYLEVAAENNPSLKSSYAQFEAAMQQTTQVNALPDPTLSFGYFVSPVETRVGPQRAKLSLSQMFPWFGTLKAREDVASFMAEAKYQAFQQRKNELYLNVKRAYYPLYEIQEQIEIQNEVLEILQSFKRLATTAFANGNGAMTDVLRVDLMIDDVETEIQLLQDKMPVLTLRFNQLLNREDNIEVNLSDKLVMESPAPATDKDSIAVRNPQLMEVELMREARKAREVVETKRGRPQLGIGLDYVFVDKRSDMDLSDNGRDVIMPLVSMTIPIFRKKYNAAIEENKLMQKSLAYQQESIHDQLISDYELAVYEADKATRLYELYAQQTQKYQQILNLLYASYGNSGEDFEELLQMQRQLLKYEMAQVSAKTKYYVTRAEIDFITAKAI